MAPIKILAVDDDPVFLMLFSHVLNGLGYEDITCLNSGDTALKELHRADPAFDCIFLDIDMPGMSGIELCRRIRSLPAYRQTPIIMVTAMKTLSHVEASFRIGATDYIHKPVDTLEIGSRLRVIGDLLLERRRRAKMELRISAQLGLSMAEIGLDEEATLGPAGVMVDFSSMRNYLQALTRLQLYRHTILAFKLVNAEELYRLNNAASYLALQSHIAQLIEKSLEPAEHIIAHAGEGEFIALISGREKLDCQKIAKSLSDGVSASTKFYEENHIATPLFHVGDPYQSGLILRNPAEHILADIRKALREQVLKHKAKHHVGL